jgi:hypothetical protein
MNYELRFCLRRCFFCGTFIYCNFCHSRSPGPHWSQRCWRSAFSYPSSRGGPAMFSEDERAHGAGATSSEAAPGKHGTSSVVDDSPAAEVAHDLVWRKSSWSAFNGDCVEVAGLRGGLVGVRDSKDRTGSVLIISGEAWQAFLDNIKNHNIIS